MSVENYIEEISWKTSDIELTLTWALNQFAKHANNLFDQDYFFKFLVTGVIPSVRNHDGGELTYDANGFLIRIVAPSYVPVVKIIDQTRIWTTREPKISFDHQYLQYELPSQRNVIYYLTKRIKTDLIHGFQLSENPDDNSLVFPKQVYAQTELKPAYLIGQRQELP